MAMRNPVRQSKHFGRGCKPRPAIIIRTRNIEKLTDSKRFIIIYLYRTKKETRLFSERTGSSLLIFCPEIIF